MVRLIAADSGTTNTRLRLLEAGRVTDTVTARVGARDGRAALARTLAELLAPWADRGAEAVLFSGMITSPTGLAEIPHVPGPLDLDTLTPVRRDFPEISPLPFLFIPGIRLGDAATPPEEGDVIRGEETELAGYMALHGRAGDRLFLHLGSHHKVMHLADGVLTQSATALTGELLAAVAEHTLIASSLTVQEGFDMTYALRGADAAEKQGLARALFSLRLMDIRSHLPTEARMGWALGALAREDMVLLANQLTPATRRVILYGREGFARVLRELIARRWPGLATEWLPPGESDALAPAGAWRIYAQRRTVHG